MKRKENKLPLVLPAKGILDGKFLSSPRTRCIRTIRRRNGRRDAFSLLELLLAIAIMVLLVSLTTIGVSSVMQGPSLTAGARTVSDSLQIARGSAQSGGDATVVVFRTSGEAAWRRLAVFEARTGTGGVWEWSQTMPWKTLKETAFVDPNYDATTESWTTTPDGLAAAQSNLAVTLPVAPLRDGSNNLVIGTDFRAVAFGPGGGLLSMTGKAVSIRIASGHIIGNNIVIDGGSTPKNSVLLVIEPVTGRVKEIRD
ncbi:MAG: prepilin-type N-terminal cleavage/methylation domain-containing protein [Verrucomicrobia bacterium]|nr:prepilin-type N-terminal cleavage/methylation domain-containing protein [Verrucomicrobiota bacterium]